LLNSLGNGFSCTSNDTAQILSRFHDEPIYSGRADPSYIIESAAGFVGLAKSAVSGAAGWLLDASASSGAANAANAVRLNTQLSAEEIASGHALDKHLGEFADLGVTNKSQFQSFIENVISNPSSTRYASDGRIFYLQERTGSVVIRNPNAEGTAFRPANWSDYMNGTTVPRRKIPY
jgi:hypothetical protein